MPDGTMVNPWSLVSRGLGVVPAPAPSKNVFGGEKGIRRFSDPRIYAKSLRHGRFRYFWIRCAERRLWFPRALSTASGLVKASLSAKVPKKSGAEAEKLTNNRARVAPFGARGLQIDAGQPF